MTNTTISHHGGVASLSTVNLQGMDLESILMAIQSQRAGLLEGQLKDQMNDVKTRNLTIAQGNDAMAELRNKSAELKDDNKFNLSNLSETTQNTLSALGIDAKSGEKTKAQLTALVEEVKAKVDAESNNQQMDMLRLQSLSNKRNEAFDLMTNFIKKMNDSRSSVLANMR